MSSAILGQAAPNLIAENEDNMKETNNTKQAKPEKQADIRAPYQAPAIVCHGLITTRAGSPAAAPDGSGFGVDPADLFGD
jgi:hypothetical protein